MVGVLGASFAAGQLIFLPLLARLVDDTAGATATVVVSLTALCIVAPLALLFLRDRPEQLGLHRYGETDDTPPPAPSAANPFGMPSTCSARRRTSATSGCSRRRSSSAARPPTG